MGTVEDNNKRREDRRNSNECLLGTLRWHCLDFDISFRPVLHQQDNKVYRGNKILPNLDTTE